MLRSRASGEWKYELGDFLYTNTADGHTLVNADAKEVWSGTFEGHAYDIWFGVWDAESDSWPPTPPIGNFYAHGRSYFEHAHVMGKEGSLVILWVGNQPVGKNWIGEWVILSGTGELENLRGRGTWKGPSFNLDYEGWIYFENDD